MTLAISKFGEVLMSRPAGKDAFLMAKAYILNSITANDEITLDFENVKETWEALDGYKDSEQLAMECRKKADELKQQKIQERKATESELEKELKAVYAKDKKQVKWLILGMIALIIICSVILLWMGELILLM